MAAYTEDFSRLQEEHTKSIQSCRDKIRKWERFRSDYEALQTRLSTLPDQLTHDIMVPFGRFAFAPGTLYHSNEVTVLLGDNWFVQTTTKHALEIVERRKKFVVERLSQEEELVKEQLTRQSLTHQLQSAIQTDTVEIKEAPPPTVREKETVSGKRKAWVAKGNIPPPRRVAPPFKRDPGDSVEAVSTELNRLSVHSDNVTTTTKTTQRIRVSHGEATNEKKTESGEEGQPLYSSPADIITSPRDIPEMPMATTTKSVKWGPNQYSDGGAQQPVPAATSPPKHRAAAPSPKPVALRPFTGQVVERLIPEATPTSATPTTDPGKKRVSHFKSSRAK